METTTNVQSARMTFHCSLKAFQEFSVDVASLRTTSTGKVSLKTLEGNGHSTMKVHSLIHLT